MELNLRSEFLEWEGTEAKVGVGFSLDLHLGRGLGV
jgi:hypothetical protein